MPRKKKWEEAELYLLKRVENLSVHLQPYLAFPPSFFHPTPIHTPTPTHNIHMHTFRGTHRQGAGREPGAGVGFPGFAIREAWRWRPETRKLGVMRG